MLKETKDTYEGMLESAISWFEDIAEMCAKLTSGNVSHQGASISGMKLHLVLKHKWYDMIASGEKQDEYRDRTPYWKKRLWDRRYEIDKIVFHRGYTSETMTKKVVEIVEDAGKEEWGAEPSVVYYVIKLKRGEE